MNDLARNALKVVQDNLALVVDEVLLVEVVERQDKWGAMQLHADVKVDGHLLRIRTVFDKWHTPVEEIIDKFLEGAYEKIALYKTSDFEKWFGRVRKIA